MPPFCLLGFVCEANILYEDILQLVKIKNPPQGGILLFRLFFVESGVECVEVFGI